MSERVRAARTRPHAQRIVRQHVPRVETWENFTDCLRWEFGFTCAICLLHECDFVLPGTGASGTGQFSVEHKVLKSTSAGEPLANDYGNCLYLCRFCNGARGARYVDETANERLLDPVFDQWDQHFTLNGARLDPGPNDPNADYTERAYAMNDGNRIVRRDARARLIDGIRTRLSDRLADIQAIDAELRGTLDDEVRHTKETQRGRWLAETESAVADLGVFVGKSRDAPDACKCALKLRRNPVLSSVVAAGWEDLPTVAVAAMPGSKRRFR